MGMNISDVDSVLNDFGLEKYSILIKLASPNIDSEWVAIQKHFNIKHLTVQANSVFNFFTSLSVICNTIRTLRLFVTQTQLHTADALLVYGKITLDRKMILPEKSTNLLPNSV